MSQLNQIELDHMELDQRSHGNSTVKQSSVGWSQSYTCPGESHSISRSVHLARLVAGYSACQNCSHRNEQGVLPCPTVQESSVERRAAHGSLISEEGIRAIYLNELDRTAASAWGAGFASILWDAQPRFGRAAVEDSNAIFAQAAPVDGTREDAEPSSNFGADMASSQLGAAAPLLAIQPPKSTRRGPVVVVGFDERPSSPDIVVGVALGLRRMGCQVIDLGQTTNPCFHFAVHHLEAAGGVYVTGSGCEPAWTGFNMALGNALPVSQPSLLQELEHRARANMNRPTRTAGSQRSFHATVPYEAGLWKFFHALRPLQVVCGTSTNILPRTLRSLFARLPCGLTFESLPVRRRDFGDPNDSDIRRVASSVVTGGKHLGLIVDDNGEQCAFVCENGRLVHPGELAMLLIEMDVRDHRSTQVIVDEPVATKLDHWAASHKATVHMDVIPTSRLGEPMKTTEANLGFANDHRVWFRGSYPVCDAILTLARVLQALSWSDAPMSQVLAKIANSSLGT